MSKTRLPKLFLEMFSIVFAVLLALTLDTWQQRLKEQKKIHKALTEIAQEIQTFSSLEGGLLYNQQLFDGLDSTIAKYQNGESVNFNFGFGRPEIRSLAWETSKESDIAAGFERGLFLEMAEVYVEYERLTKILDYHNQFNLESDPDMPPFTRARHIHRHLRQTIFRIQELDRKATAFLELHKDESFVKDIFQD